MSTHLPAEQTALAFTESESLGLGYNAPADSKTQRGRLLKLLLEAHGEWVSLPTILDLRISQYSSRLHELRKMGFNIQNRVEAHGKQRHSFFRLLLHPVTGNGANAPRKEHL